MPESPQIRVILGSLSALGGAGDADNHLIRPRITKLSDLRSCTFFNARNEEQSGGLSERGGNSEPSKRRKSNDYWVFKFHSGRSRDSP